NDEKGLDYFIGENDFVEDLPDDFKNGYVAISVGAAHATKTLPKEKLRSLVKKLNKPVILLGGKEDIEKADYVCQDLISPVINACGKYRINQSAYLLKEARVVISHDTGLMHIASAFNKPIISIWGNTIPEFGMYPYMPENIEHCKIFEIENLKCRPCSKLGYNKCPKKHFKCMELIDLDKVADQANAWF
ncbi:MAG: glycosyl transferase, partial [Bacteroidetes bacterium]